MDENYDDDRILRSAKVIKTSSYNKTIQASKGSAKKIMNKKKEKGETEKVEIDLQSDSSSEE